MDLKVIKQQINISYLNGFDKGIEQTKLYIRFLINNSKSQSIDELKLEILEYLNNN